MALTEYAPGRSRRALRIIVADDDPDTVTTLCAILHDEGHKVVCCLYRGDAVLDQVRAHQPDVVLLDIGMPGLTGFSIARRLRKEFDKACPLLVAITAWHQESAKAIGKLSGFHHYLTKPYSTDALLDVLANLVHSSPRSRQMRDF